MNLSSSRLVFLVSLFALGVYSAPLDGKTIIGFEDSKFQNFSNLWLNEEVTEKCLPGENDNIYTVGLCNSYYNILSLIQDSKLDSLIYKKESKLNEELNKNDFCDRFIAILPTTSSIQEVKNDVESFKRRNHNTNYCERFCRETIFGQKGDTIFTIPLCKLVFIAHEELAKQPKTEQVALKTVSVLGNSSVTQSSQILDSGKHTKKLTVKVFVRLIQ